MTLPLPPRVVLPSGLPSQAFEYIHYNKGIEGEADYPYKGQVSLTTGGLCMCGGRVSE